MGDWIDLNGDVGEGFGPWSKGDDERFIPLLTSANVACGMHAGDPLTMQRTVRVAMASGVGVGAHPGYADLAGFGRRDLDMTDEELEASLVYQVGALAAIVAAAGGSLRHVKPHGALYNRAAVDERVAAIVAKAVRSVDAGLVMVGLAGSRLVEAASRQGLAVAAEAFADRAYEPDGTLRSRRLPGAVLADPEEAARQAVSIARHGRVTAADGTTIELRAETICVHGDTPGAVGVARMVRDTLEREGVAVHAFDRP